MVDHVMLVMCHMNHVNIMSKYYSRYPSTDMAPIMA